MKKTNEEKLSYNIIYVSTESEQNSALTLYNPKPNSRGWQSAGRSSYPQEIMLQLQRSAKLKRIELLSHQSKISSKIEIYITFPNAISLTKLGDVVFNNNESSHFQRREKKIIKTDCECDKIKFVLYKNYANIVNTYNQVGIISIELYGNYIDEKTNLLRKLQGKITELTLRKKNAIDIEDYDEAKRVNIEIEGVRKEIEKVQNGEISYREISDVNGGKKKAVSPIRKSVNRYQQEDDSEDNKKGKTSCEFNIDNNNKKKNVIDVDSQRVGNVVSFSQMVEKQLEKNPFPEATSSPLNTRSNKQKDIILKAEDQIIANPLLSFLPPEIVNPLFSKQSKLIEESISKIISDIENHPKMTNFDIKAKANDIIITCSDIASHIFTLRFIPPILSSINMMFILFNKFQSLFNKSFSNQSICTFIEHSLDLLGDSNTKVKENIDKLIQCYAEISQEHSKIINLLITKQIKKSLVKSSSHICSRYQLLNKLITLYGYKEKEFDGLIKYAVTGYQHSKPEVREISLEVIVTIYRKEGGKVRPYFSKLRPSQIKTIEDKLDEIDKNPQKESNAFDDEHTCPFCGLFSKEFTEDKMTIHQYKDCPMLIDCEYCKQVIEICKLNSHRLIECEGKDKLIECRYCKIAIEKDKIDIHEKEECPGEINEDKDRLCPLCHVNVEEEDVWKRHFMMRGCEKNKRTKS